MTSSGGEGAAGRQQTSARAARLLALGGCAVAILLGIAASPALAANPVQAENALPGDSHWTAALQAPLAGYRPIEGYASATSVRPGGSIAFQVSTNPVARYRIEISRLGWYGGAGGRRVACLVGSSLDQTCSSDQVGVLQPRAPAPDPVTGEVRAGWSTTDTLHTPSTWTTGYYLAVFVLTSGSAAGQTGFVPFVVQAPVGDHAAVLVQVPTNTWQAYNAWGGQDYYTTPRAVKISFDRPSANRMLFSWEYPLVRFLERGGWDVSYATDDAVDANPSILLDHRLDMTAGHDEYWTKAMRDGWEAARAAGVNLAFMGANTGFWQVRYEDAGRTMVGYKYSPDPDPDPAEKTTEFRWLTPARPECELMGVEFQGSVLPAQYLDYTMSTAAANDPWFIGSGLSAGAVLPGLIGYETDAITPGCHVPPVTPLLSYSGPPASTFGGSTQADAVRYTACSGAEVFSAGSLQFSWGLDSWRDPSLSDPALPPAPPASPELQSAMTRALGDLTQSHVPQPGPPQICVPAASFTASVPWSTVGQPVTFTSTATDAYGELETPAWTFVDGGPAVSASGQSVAQSFERPGMALVRLIASDTSGATATRFETQRVCPCPPPGTSGVVWPLEAQTGTDCQLTPIGLLARRGSSLSFRANQGIASLTIGVSRITTQSGRIALVSAVKTFVAQARGAVAVGAPRAPVVVDVTALVGGLIERQQFLVPSHGGRPMPIGQLRGLACDGTVATVLTPAFGGPRNRPLRVEVSGAGRLNVVLGSAAGKPVDRLTVTSHGRTRIVTLPVSALAPGVYRVTVSSRRSALPQPLTLDALALGQRSGSRR